MGFHEKQMLTLVSMEIFVRYIQKGEHDDYNLYLGKCLGHTVFSGAGEAQLPCFASCPNTASLPFSQARPDEKLCGESRDFHLRYLWLPIGPFIMDEQKLTYILAYILLSAFYHYSFPFWSRNSEKFYTKSFMVWKSLKLLS